MVSRSSAASSAPSPTTPTTWHARSMARSAASSRRRTRSRATSSARTAPTSRPHRRSSSAARRSRPISSSVCSQASPRPPFSAPRTRPSSRRSRRRCPRSRPASRAAACRPSPSPAPNPPDGCKASPACVLGRPRAEHYGLPASLPCSVFARQPGSAVAPDYANIRPMDPLVMGIVNVTPDSFSDGGLFLDRDAAVAHGRELVVEGAQILDIGGESTRPGAQPVSVSEEVARVIPVIETLAGEGVRISIDTTKAEVAKRALEAGATIVNDVAAFRFDPAIASVTADAGATCVLMHMLGEPRTMQLDPRYDEVVSDVKAFLEERLAYAVGQGVPEDRIWLDPGIGFGKTLEHNLELIARLDEIVAIGRPVVFGASRKSFLGKLTGRQVDERLAGTIAANIIAYERGARVFRVHDVAPTVDALQVAGATVRRP